MDYFCNVLYYLFIIYVVIIVMYRYYINNCNEFILELVIRVIFILSFRFIFSDSVLFGVFFLLIRLMDNSMFFIFCFILFEG